MPDQAKDFHYDTEDLADYFTGDIDEREAIELETHLTLCAFCRREADEVSAASLSLISLSAELPLHAPGLAPDSGNASAPILVPEPSATSTQVIGQPSVPALVFPSTQTRWIRLAAVASVLAVAASSLLFVSLFSNQNLRRQLQQQSTNLADANKTLRKTEAQTAALAAQLKEVENRTAPDGILVAKLLSLNQIRRGDKDQPNNEIVIPPSGCTLRLDLRPQDLNQRKFTAAIYNTDTGASFAPDLVRTGKAGDGRRAVQVLFHCEKVQNREYAVSLRAGPNTDNMRDVGTWVFSVARPSGPRTR